MDKILRVLTDQRTTWLSSLAQVLLFMGDAEVQQILVDLGMGDGAMKWTINATRLGLLALTALGYSPLKRPEGSDNAA